MVVDMESDVSRRRETTQQFPPRPDAAALGRHACRSIPREHVLMSPRRPNRGDEPMNFVDFSATNMASRDTSQRCTHQGHPDTREIRSSSPSAHAVAAWSIGAIRARSPGIRDALTRRSLPSLSRTGWRKVDVSRSRRSREERAARGDGRRLVGTELRGRATAAASSRAAVRRRRRAL